MTPWVIQFKNSLGQNTGVGNCSLLQGVFPTQGLNPGLPHGGWFLYHVSHQHVYFIFLPASLLDHPLPPFHRWWLDVSSVVTSSSLYPTLKGPTQQWVIRAWGVKSRERAPPPHSGCTVLSWGGRGFNLNKSFNIHSWSENVLLRETRRVVKICPDFKQRKEWIRLQSGVMGQGQGTELLLLLPWRRAHIP